MLEFIRTRLGQGTRTAAFPAGQAEFPERFRGRPTLDPTEFDDAANPAQIPSALIVEGADGRACLDLGACLFAPEEAITTSAGTVRFTTDPALSARKRSELITEAGELPRVSALDRETRRLFGRSLRLRSVAAGSCNGCEAELVALGNVVFDMARFGVQFVASPRHADGLVITGAVSQNMRDALYRTFEATPDPKLVIAVGTCAVSGGPFRDSPEVLNGVPRDLPVDLWIPGCPPHPITILDGILRLLGQLDAGDDRGKVVRAPRARA